MKKKKRIRRKAMKSLTATTKILSGLVVVLAVSTLALTGTASAKSLYLVADHHTAQFDAWNINPNGTTTYQASYNLAYATDPSGIDMDEDSKTLFVTTEFSHAPGYPNVTFEFVDATTMTPLGYTDVGGENFAGIAVDDANDIVYTVYRATNDLFAFDWNPDGPSVSLRAGYPINLPNCSGAYGIALDETRGTLWVADGWSAGDSGDRDIGDRDIFEVSGLGTDPVDIEVVSGGFDTILGLFDANGSIVATDDDGGVDALSRFSNVAPDNGTVRFGISGYYDVGFDGNHSEFGSYQIAVWPNGSSVPTGPIVNESEPNTEFGERDIFASTGELLIYGSIVQFPISDPFVRAYDTTTWTEDTSKSFTPSHNPIDVAVDRQRGFVYTVSMSLGAGGMPNGSTLLSKYDPATRTETTVDLGHQGVGVAVDETTGYVYVTSDQITQCLEVWDTSTSPWTQVQATAVFGSPAGICIPQTEVSYNPLSLSKSDGLTTSECVYAGANINYEIYYDNTNAYDVHNVVITDTLPAETRFVSASDGGTYDSVTHTVRWNIGSLSAGAPQSYVTLVGTLEQGTTPGTTVTNFAMIDSDETPVTTQREDTDVCTEIPPPPQPPTTTPTISVTTDKTDYKTFDTMSVEIEIANPTNATQWVVYKWWLTIPGFDFMTTMATMPMTLPAGYSQTFSYPIYVGYWGEESFGALWGAALLDPGTNEIICFDSAYWCYKPIRPKNAGAETKKTPKSIASEIKEEIGKVGLPG